VFENMERGLGEKELGDVAGAGGLSGNGKGLTFWERYFNSTGWFLTGLEMAVGSEETLRWMSGAWQ